MPKYNLRIHGSVDSDDPELAYLHMAGRRFESADDVIDYLAEFLAEEVAFETIDIQVVSIEHEHSERSPNLKLLK